MIGSIALALGLAFQAPVIPSKVRMPTIVAVPAGKVTVVNPCTPASGYLHCRTFTIDHTQAGGSTLTSYPVLVSTTLGSSKLQNSNCFDLIFTSDSAGATKIPWEQETCTQATGAIIDWVGVPSISSSADTVFYASYDNSGISTAQNTGGAAPTNVWDSNFVAVYHFATASPFSLSDSTSNGYTLTNNNSVTATSGQIDGATNYVAASSQFLNNSSVSLSSSPDVTVSYWNNANNTTSSRAFGFGAMTGGSNNDNPCPFVDGNCYWDWGNSSTGRVQAAYSYNNQWALVTVVAKGDNSFQGLYLNGSLAGSQNSGAAPTSVSQLNIGADQYAASQGSVDEFRLSKIRRPAGWITADYNSQKSGSTFLTVSPEY